MTVTATAHGSHLTRDDFQYNGLDVTVGDWIADVTGGKCLKLLVLVQRHQVQLLVKLKTG